MKNSNGEALSSRPAMLASAEAGSTPSLEADRQELIRRQMPSILAQPRLIHGQPGTPIPSASTSQGQANFVSNAMDEADWALKQ